VSDLTTSSVHDARDAEDQRLLEAGEYARLVETYYGVIVKRCQARTKSDGAAFDVAADVVIRLLGELKGGKRYAVPFRVVVHKVIGWKLAEHFAGRSRDVELGDDIADGGSIEIVDESSDLMTLLEGLPQREREVAGLRIVGGLEPDAIAARLGINRNNVDQAWHRAKRKLRERLEATT
jgi:RNA polymerase sigma factor (sigma-70 family)